MFVNRSLRLVIVLLFSILTNSYAQKLKISGTIKDKVSKEPLIGAVVLEKGTPHGVVTDINGRFQIELDMSTQKTLSVAYLGYKPSQFILRDRSRSYYEFLLQENIIQTKEVVVTSSRLSQKAQESPITVERMNTVAIKETPAIGFYEGLSNLKGVDMTSASLAFKIINTRGFNSTSPVRTLQLIDGMDNQAPGLNFSLGNFVGASEIDVESVDLIVGANSALYGPNAFNGVINITTKDPFKYPGFNIQLKAANRNLFDGSIRFARVSKKINDEKLESAFAKTFAQFNNKYLTNKFAYKFNASYLRANDFMANNFGPAYRFLSQPNNSTDSPLGYDAVNVYGDETTGNPLTRSQLTNLSPGDTNKYYLFRSGYKESDLTTYQTYSLKMQGGVYYKLTKDLTLSYFYNRGTGSTVYQGDNRYALKDILFQQHKVELKSDKLSLKYYTTLEDAGNSYDLVFTAYKLLQKAGSYQQFKNAFFDAYNDTVANNPNVTFDAAAQYARAQADIKTGKLQAGTPEFDAAFRDITGKASFLPTSASDVGGTQFKDKSSLSHYEGIYDFDPSKWNKSLPKTLKLGASYRQYNPRSSGTIFSDTLKNRNDVNSGFTEINVYEYSVFGASEIKFGKDKWKLVVAARENFHKNFKANFSPAASLLYNFNQFNTLRFTYTSAVRNPTLQDQYLFYNIGRAILRGNIDGFGGDKYILLTDYFDKYLGGKPFQAYNVDPIKPEKVQTVELGYKGLVLKKLYVDLNAYYSEYKDFIGNILVINNPLTTTQDKVYRVAANAKTKVSTTGASIGLNYYFEKYYSLSGNYTYSILAKKDNSDPLIPSYNTPPHKFNLSFSGRNLFKKFGFNVSYKYVQSFEFTGSPQFTGRIPSYGLLDAQANYKLTAYNTTFKIGSANLLNNIHYEAYGAAQLGRLVYASINFEL